MKCFLYVCTFSCCLLLVANLALGADNAASKAVAVGDNGTVKWVGPGMKQVGDTLTLTVTVKGGGTFSTNPADTTVTSDGGAVWSVTVPSATSIEFQGKGGFCAKQKGLQAQVQGNNYWWKRLWT